MDKKITECKWRDKFNKKELDTFIDFYKSKYDSYTNFYKNNKITKKEIDEMNSYLLKNREKRINKIPEDLPYKEKLRLRRAIIRDTKLYSENEVNSFNGANEYITWQESIKRNEKINFAALFEYWCYTENNRERCNAFQLKLADKCEKIRDDYSKVAYSHKKTKGVKNKK